MMTMDYFRAIQGGAGHGSAKEVKQADYRRQFGWDFDSSINVVYDVLRNDAPQDFIIVETKTGCDWWARPGETCNIGDIMYYNGLHWLVTDVRFSDDLTRSGEMVRCNRQIRWQNQETGEIIERWCLVTKPYTSNIAEGMAIATSNREFKVQLPYDAETLLVDLDRRFLLEMIGGTPKAYRVVSVDAQTNKYQDIDGGFLVWNLEQCAYNPAVDNAEMMIADYFDPHQTDAPELSGDGVYGVINGRDTIPVGRKRNYTAVFAGRDGVAVDVGDIAWRVEAPDGITWTADGASLQLFSADDPSLEGAEILLYAYDVAEAYPVCLMSVKVVGLL